MLKIDRDQNEEASYNNMETKAQLVLVVVVLHHSHNQAENSDMDRWLMEDLGHIHLVGVPEEGCFRQGRSVVDNKGKHTLGM